MQHVAKTIREHHGAEKSASELRKVEIGPTGNALAVEDGLENAEAGIDALRTAARRLVRSEATRNALTIAAAGATNSTVVRHAVALAGAILRLPPLATGPDTQSELPQPTNETADLPTERPRAMHGWAHSEDVFPDIVAAFSAGFWQSAPPREWLYLWCSLVALFMLDFWVLRRLRQSVGNIALVFFWVLVAFIYCTHYMFMYGRNAGSEWLLGYVLEIILSVDNIFVFYVIFDSFRPPEGEVQMAALYYGVAGAVFSRLLLFFVFAQVLHVVKWVRFVFGALLIVSGVKCVFDDDDDWDPSQNSVVVALQSLLGTRLLSSYDPDGRMFVYDDAGRLCATMLFPLVVCVEATDVLFAFDSLSAKVGQIHNQYASFSSSAFAILALRALFFVLRDLVDYFCHLKYGLCVILIFIGVELLCADFVQLPTSDLMGVICAVFLISMLSSVRHQWALQQVASEPGIPAPQSAAAGPQSDATDTAAAAMGTSGANVKEVVNEDADGNESLDEGDDKGRRAG